MYNNGKWTMIGQCAVDSGQIILVDPCYVIPDKDDTPKVFYDDILATWDYDAKPPQRYIPFEMGVVVESGYGDGSYPVFAQYDNHGRLVRAMIDFDYYEE